MKIELDITPVPKPRMTRSDQWKKRKCTDQYWRYKDKLKSLISPSDLPECLDIIFVIPFPKSYGIKKKDALRGQPHQLKPDWDNLAKAFFDALFEDDKHIYQVKVTKLWGDEGKIIIRDLSN